MIVELKTLQAGVPRAASRRADWRPRGVVVFLALWSAVVVLPAAARGDDKPEDSTVKVHLSVILATKDHDRIDPKLERIADELKKTFKFTGFELKQDTIQTGEMNKIMAFSLPSPYSLEVTPKSREKNAVTLLITVYEKKGDKKQKKLSTTVTVRCRKHQLVGGLPTDGGQLVLAISGA